MSMVAKPPVKGAPVPEVTRVHVKGKPYVATKEAAKLAEVEVDTFNAYVTRGLAPAASFKIGTIKFYDLAAIRKWMRERPGSGARTDLRPPKRGK